MPRSRDRNAGVAHDHQSVRAIHDPEHSPGHQHVVANALGETEYGRCGPDREEQDHEARHIPLDRTATRSRRHVRLYGRSRLGDQRSPDPKRRQQPDRSRAPGMRSPARKPRSWSRDSNISHDTSTAEVSSSTSSLRSGAHDDFTIHIGLSGAWWMRNRVPTPRYTSVGSAIGSASWMPPP